ncbi:hypothetical protein ISU02_07360 [Fusibacter sp. Q10-2]|uniref:MBG domain-containing protein n=2 Tax=Fusibacter ferrireducens TaxID=2785058 RepID=A0ABR9ZRI1_9FIRM|nr:hypothetical protein [Fusibacter ferrireducens]
MRVNPGTIVYGGISATFNQMDVADYGIIGSSTNSYSYASGQNIYLKTEGDSGFIQNNTGWAYVGKAFIYSGSTRNASVYVKGNYKGMLETSQGSLGALPGSTSSAISIVASVYDMETGARAAQRTILSRNISGMFDAEYPTGNYYDELSVYLQNGHAYKIVLEATAESKAFGVTKSKVDFKFFDRSIKMTECGVVF